MCIRDRLNVFCRLSVLDHGRDGANFAAVYVLPYQSRLGGTSQSYSPAPPVICNVSDATATNRLKQRFNVGKPRKIRPRPQLSQCTLARWAASVRVGACRALEHAAELSRCLLHPHPYLTSGPTLYADMRPDVHPLSAVTVRV